VLPNEAGRVIDTTGAVPGVYVTGWLKRGPSGVIGSNRFCARETVDSLIADTAELKSQSPQMIHDDLPTTLVGRGIRVTDQRGWQRIDRTERQRGVDSGRPRRRIAARDELLAVAHAH
jgi:ferredoxin/flavodoxin---NADP+ reductase